MLKSNCFVTYFSILSEVIEILFENVLNGCIKIFDNKYALIHSIRFKITPVWCLDVSFMIFLFVFFSVKGVAVIVLEKICVTYL